LIVHQNQLIVKGLPSLKFYNIEE